MTDTRTLWRDMTPEEKGALLLGWQQGKVIEFYVEDGYWLTTECEPHEWERDAYRIKPEPKRETMALYAAPINGNWNQKLIGTVDFIDGKPDPASIKMEEL